MFDDDRTTLDNINRVDHTRRSMFEEQVEIPITSMEDTLIGGDNANIAQERVELTLDDKILRIIIEMQALWDAHKVSLVCQDEMLKLLFGSLSVFPNLNSCLSKLLVQFLASWNGTLCGI